eukprot:1698761-Rhodomonas_salina.1
MTNSSRRRCAALLPIIAIFDELNQLFVNAHVSVCCMVKGKEGRIVESRSLHFNGRRGSLCKEQRRRRTSRDIAGNEYRVCQARELVFFPGS